MRMSWMEIEQYKWNVAVTSLTAIGSQPDTLHGSTRGEPSLLPCAPVALLLISMYLASAVDTSTVVYFL